VKFEYYLPKDICFLHTAYIPCDFILFLHFN